MSNYRSIEFMQIAAEWDSAYLGGCVPLLLLNMFNGLNATQSKRNGDYRVSRIETISKSTIDEEKVGFVSNLSKDIVEKYLVRKGDIIFSHINSAPHLGKTALSIRNYDDLLHGINLLLIRANYETISPIFLNYIFNYYRQLGVFKKICSRAVNQSSINQAKLKALEIPLPPLPEQKKIVHILSTVQGAIEEQERLIEVTTELKGALMQKLFTEGTRGEPQKETNIGPVPESWEVIELGELITKAQYGLSEKGNPDGNFPMLRMTNQINGKISVENLQYVEIGEQDFEKFKVNSGDILFNRTNSHDLVGRTAILDIEGEFVFASYLIRISAKTARLNSFYLNHYFNSNETQVRLKSIATRAVSQSNISASRLKGFAIPLPNCDEQEKIVNSLNSLDTKISIHQRKKTLLTDLFRTLLHKLMTAEIRVNDVDFHNMELN